MPGALPKERLLLKRGRRSFGALSREIPLICDFSENFQKSMSFFFLRCCGKGVEELLKNLQFDVVFEASHVAVK